MGWLEAAGWVWGVSAAALVVLERLHHRHIEGYRDELWLIALVYAGLLLLAPVVLAFLIYEGFAKGWGRTFGHLFRADVDPFSAPEEEWDTDRDLFLGDLIRRRKLFDRRLKKEKIGSWPMYRFGSQPDAAVLRTVEVHRDLAAAGVPDAQIWAKLDAFFSSDGRCLPDDAGTVGYLMDRLDSFDPGYTALGEDFMRRHVEICERWHARRYPPDKLRWPPVDWLKRRIDLAEFERQGDGADPMADGAPAALFLGDLKSREWDALKVRMVEGDEVWTFSSPPETWAKLFGRAGVALVRGGKAVYHVTTAMN